jgi:hypothetical protein
MGGKLVGVLGAASTGVDAVRVLRYSAGGAECRRSGTARIACGIGMICGAKHRKTGGFCRLPAMKGRRRCRHHGGKLFGSPIGAWRNLGPAHAQAKRKQALYKALGLSWPGGHHRKPERVMTMVEEAKMVLQQGIAEMEAALPLDALRLRVEELTAAQALGRASLVGLHQLVRIVEMPFEPENLKQMRLIGDMALGVNKLLQRHAEGERSHDLIGKLLAAIEAEKAEK